MEQTKKKSNRILKISILSVAAIGMANSFMAPALAEIAAAFPQVTMTNIQLIMTFAMLGQFPFTLITGILGTRLRSKTLVIMGNISLIVGGLLPYFLSSNIVFLYIGSALMGIGQGILLTMISVLITQHFAGEERSQMFGFQSSVSNAANMIMSLVGGFLASTYWKNVYLTTLLCIPTLIMVVLWLPRGDKPTAPAETVEKAEGKKGVGLRAIPIVIFLLLFAVGFATNILNSAMLISERNMGDASVAGLMASLAGLVSIAGGILYKYIMKASKSFILFIGALSLSAGLFIAYFSQHIVIYFIGTALVFLGFTIGFSGSMDSISRLVEPSQVSGSMGLLMGMQSLGSMVSPYIVNGITGFFGEVSAEAAYRTGAIWALGVAVYAFILGIANREKFAAVTVEAPPAT